MRTVLLGCGDIGRRIVQTLLLQGHDVENIIGFVNTITSAERCAGLGVIGLRFDLDKLNRDVGLCHNAQVYYTVAPQKEGVTDERSKSLLSNFNENEIKPKKVVLISTTGVYGDYAGEWVSEVNETKPQTERGQRRLDAETQWLAWGKKKSVPVVVLRVPGIYAKNRLPRKRIEQGIPVVKADECGFTNRVHADDLAQMCVAAMRKAKAGEVFNATDGTPGKISEYLQEAARILDLEPLPEISMTQAQETLSRGMLSYLSESRKISNEKILTLLNVDLRYPDYRIGLRY